MSKINNDIIRVSKEEHPKGTMVKAFQNLDTTKVEIVGGKGANLGELYKIDGIQVPQGFCITTRAYKQIIGQSSLIKELLDKLKPLNAKDTEEIRKVSNRIRKAIEGLTIPQNLSDEIFHHLSELGVNDAYAVRSSATAEDLPTASFAGQQDTYLNIIGKENILKHISKCWASLFTERAVIYRIQNGYDHRLVYLAVVVQKMVFPHASGILFTADPVSSNRKVLSIDAGYGLGEALVSGQINADNYKIRDGKIVERKISPKNRKVNALHGGGTKIQTVENELQNNQVLTDEQILELARIGRKIERYFGYPQDIEWCMADDTFYMVQSRPITTLFPIPETNEDAEHVFISVGHQQMMTDPMRPLGLSIWQLTTGRPMHEAACRLFVDVAPMLASPESRRTLLRTMGQHDPLMKDALETLIERGGFDKSTETDNDLTFLNQNAKTELEPSVVSTLMEKSRNAQQALKQNIKAKSGMELVDFIHDSIQELKNSLSNPQLMGAIMASNNASVWLNEKLKEWLGEKNVADTLTLSVADNITSEMGLALLDVADVIRQYPETIDYLEQVDDDEFLDDLRNFDGGQETKDAIKAFLETYGMRCAGEIDITRTRWAERPSMLIPLLLSNISNFEPGESKTRFENGRQTALKKEEEILSRLKQLPDGEQKAKETKEMIDQLRDFSGYREYPKYDIVSRFYVLRRALLKEAEQLVKNGFIHEKEDIYYLTFDELRELLKTQKADYQKVYRRKVEFKKNEKLTPPRVITSDGEIIKGAYKFENLPANALAGLAVSSGTVEGRARVSLRMENAELEEGDILVTTFTDPSWTALFVSIKGLITEVGGLMTHGAVVAREYGLPAVVGVENATQLIKDGQQIRVNGTEGYVEIL